MKKMIFAFLTALCVNVTVNAATSVQVIPTTETQESVQPMDTGSYWFGRVYVNSRNVVRYTVTNTGDEPLDYASSNIWGMFLEAYHNCNRTLRPKEQCQFEIVYWPAFEGHHNGEFALNFKQDSIQIHVWGEAAKRF